MTKEQFIAMGLTGEQAQKAAEASAKELKGFIPKARFGEVNEVKKQLEKNIAARDKQLEDLKKVDAEGLKAEIGKLRGENKAAREKYDADMKDLSIKTALKLALYSDTHDPDLVAGLLDISKIELDSNGKIKGGLEDQVKALKTSKAFLFKKRDAVPVFKGVKLMESKSKDGNPASRGALLARAANIEHANN